MRKPEKSFPMIRIINTTKAGTCLHEPIVEAIFALKPEANVPILYKDGLL